ncbi:hypothetical protein DL764_002467 [Monosporascus ibericus]|uniref:Uncharacterized protein n=1 Tax=Monosporascus ibericus TaxID=155417 RepID=A0A4Q4TPH5_9PEZI|nr:hypothetical protein DL764_002467 [Monosporascus ibericus]
MTQISPEPGTSEVPTIPSSVDPLVTVFFTRSTTPQPFFGETVPAALRRTKSSSSSNYLDRSNAPVLQEATADDNRGRPSSVTQDVESPFVTIGAFLLKKDRNRDKFSSPKASSQPEPIWRIGDGFSEDEKRLEPGFLIPGKHKRRRTRSLSRLGRLETEPGDGKDTQVTSLKFGTVPAPQIKRRPGPPKDIWPTTENFADDTTVRVAERTIPDSQSFIPETQRYLQRTHRCRVEGDEKPDSFPYVGPRNRSPLEFKDFRGVQNTPPKLGLPLATQTTLSFQQESEFGSGESEGPEEFEEVYYVENGEGGYEEAVSSEWISALEECNGSEDSDATPGGYPPSTPSSCRSSELSHIAEQALGTGRGVSRTVDDRDVEDDALEI